MKLEFKGNVLTVTQEPTDKKYYGAGGESSVLYAIKEQLNKEGFDLIKKRMWKDGHMVDDTLQYLRSRKEKKNVPYLQIYNADYMVTSVIDELNKRGETTFTVYYYLNNVQITRSFYLLVTALLQTDEKYFENFVRSYLATAAWAEMEGDPSYLPFSKNAKLIAKKDCLQFIQMVGKTFVVSEAKAILTRQGSDLYYLAACDFWFTRKGHGVGFWDREIYNELAQGGCDKLTAIAKEFKSNGVFLQGRTLNFG